MVRPKEVRESDARRIERKRTLGLHIVVIDKDHEVKSVSGVEKWHGLRDEEVTSAYKIRPIACSR